MKNQHAFHALFVFQFLISFAAYAVSPIHSVNIFSGVPQPADEGANRTGGFGDIAANVNAAKQIKILHPEWEVRLMVTSVEKSESPLIPTTNEIVKIMIPGLNPNLKNTVQISDGVEFIFLSSDFGKVLNQSEKKHAKNAEMLLQQLAAELPRADLTLNFSHYHGGSPFMRQKTRLALGIEEYYENEGSINEQREAEGKLSPFIELTSGPLSLGFLLDHAKRNAVKNNLLIRDWFESKYERLPESFLPTFAYTAEWQASQVYLDAIADIASLPVNQGKNIVLFLKSHPELNPARLPKNVKLVLFKGLPDQVIKALVEESFVAPTVTGDISLGKAISALRPDRTLVYESLPWKNEMATRFRKLIEKESGHSLEPVFLYTSTIHQLNPKQLLKKSKLLVKALLDQSFQRSVYETMQGHLQDWDLLQNTLAVAEELLDSTSRSERKKVNDVVDKIKFNFAEKSLAGRYRQLSSLMTYHDFTSLLTFNAGRVPELKHLWSSLPQEQAEQVFWFGGTLRGFIHWHRVMLESHTAQELMTQPMPGISVFQLLGGQDIDVFAPNEMQEAIAKNLEGMQLDHIDTFSRERYQELARFSGASLEKTAINFQSISDPLGGLRDYYEGHLVFHLSDHHAPQNNEMNDSDFTHIGEALRYIRFVHFNLPELTPDAASVEKIKKLTFQENWKLFDEGKVAWLEISFDKLLKAAGGKLEPVLKLLKEYHLLNVLAELKIDIPPHLVPHVLNWLKENEPEVCNRILSRS